MSRRTFLSIPTRQVTGLLTLLASMALPLSAPAQQQPADGPPILPSAIPEVRQTTLAPLRIEAPPPLPNITPPPQATELVFYGLPMLGIDVGLMFGAPLLATALGGFGAGPPIAVAALAYSAWLFSGPIVHWTHGNREHGWRSLAMRSLGTLGSAALGFGLGAWLPGPILPFLFALNFACGAIITTSIIDWTVLGFEPRVVSGIARTQARNQRSFAPFVTPMAGAGGWLAGVSGTF
ncbi:MAG: hypothetical protein Q8Q09_25640 [Deltaproteobacteria bacterium]|nr:hypothetical protein [Deltaproteobacteria bacterium]